MASKTNRFLQEFINDVKAHRCTLVSSIQQKDYMIDYYRSSGIPLIGFLRKPLARGSGPTIFWSPGTLTQEGYIVVVTDENPFIAFKHICLAGVIIAYGNEMINEYEENSNNLEFFLKMHPDIQMYYEQLLAAYLT